MTFSNFMGQKTLEIVILTTTNVFFCKYRIFVIVIVILHLPNVGSKRHNNVTSVVTRRHLAGIDNNAFPWL